MTLVVDKYYRKISENIDNLKIKFDISSLLVKSKEHDNKIENIYDKDYIDNNFLVESEIDKKNNEILNKVNNHFYSRSYINDNYLLKSNIYDKKYIDDNIVSENEIDKKDNNILNTINNHFYNRQYIKDNYLIKGNTYDKKYIDDNYFTKQVLNNSFASYNTKIDTKNNETLNKIKNEYYNKNELDINFNNLYNRTSLDIKFDDIYNKEEVNEKTSKLDRNIVLFNQNLIRFIDIKYKEDQKLQDDNIKNNKSKFDNFIINTFSTFSNNISNINNSQNSRLTNLENKNLNDTQITKINQLENIDLVKINKYSYYIKEFFMHNIDLVRRFNITSELDFIQVLQFEIDRNFLVNDIIKFFISIKFLYENMKMYWVLYFKIDVHYKDDVLIKSFKKQMTSKGFIFKNLVTFNIDNMFKLNKQTDRLIFKLYMYKVSTAYKNDVTITLSNILEENYCNLIWYSNQ